MSNDTKDVVADIAEKLEERHWPYELALKFPVAHGKRQITSLLFQRGTMGCLTDMKVDGVPPANDLLLIASRLCGEPVAALKLLDPEDGAEVIEMAMTFFARCLGAGRTP